MSEVRLNLLAALLAATTLTACAVDDGPTSTPPEKVTEVRLGAGRRVEFLRLQSGGTAMIERGPADAERLDFDQAVSESGGVLGLYRKLAGREAPERLAAAALQVQRATEPTERPGIAPLLGAVQSTKLGARQAAGVASTEAPLTIPLPTVSSLAAAVWKTTHCPSSWRVYYDGCTAPTNIVETVTDYRDTKMYNVGLQANGGEDAFIRIHRWNGSDWDQIVYEKVPAGQYWGMVFVDNGAYYQTEAWSRSGRGTIHFYERFRYSMAVPYFVNNKPGDVSSNFSNDLGGITHDEDNWYMTRTHYSFWAADTGDIAKVPFTKSLSTNPSTQRSMPESWNTHAPECWPCGGGRTTTTCCDNPILYDHFGDLVRRGGYLYVSMQGPAGAAVAVFDTNLNAIGYAKLDHNTSAAFVALNPKTGFFYVPSAGNKLEKYSITEASVTSGAPVANWEGTLTLSQSYSNFQGAKFSSNGNLWLLNGWDGKNRELWGIDGTSGLLYVQGGLDPGDCDESEGVDIIDLDTETRPGMAGQLHLQMLRNDASDDNWWFMHWRAPMNRL